MYSLLAEGWTCVLGLYLSLHLLLKQAQSEPHHPALLAALASELRCKPSAIVDLELNVCDTQPGVIGGMWDGWLGDKREYTMFADRLSSSLQGSSLHLYYFIFPGFDGTIRICVSSFTRSPRPLCW